MEAETDPGARLSIGKQIEARRLQLRMTGQDVERAARIASGSISRIESGVRRPLAATLVPVSRALKCHFVIDETGVELRANP